MGRLLVGLVSVGCWLITAGPAMALSVQEAILRATPGVALVTALVNAEVTMDCGQGPVAIQPAPFAETGTGWFVDGRGWLITNAHVVDPAHRQPPWVGHELKKKAIDLACVEPVLRDRGLAPGQRPDVEDEIRRNVSGRALASAKISVTPQLTVTLQSKDAKGRAETLVAEVKKFSPPISFDAQGQPTKDSGRDLALLRV